MEVLSQKIDESFKLKSPEDTMDYYQKWASSYDEDIAKGGYRGPMCLARWAQKHIPDKNAKILDIACGTGKVGKLMTGDNGYTNVSGVDGSSEMINAAKAINAYKDYYVELIHPHSALKNVAKKSFDAVIGIGCFDPSHLNFNHLEVFYEHCKKGGLVLFGVSDEYLDERGHQRYETWPEGNFEKRCKELEDKGVWKQIERVVYKDFDTTPNYSNPGHFFAFKVLQ